VGQPALPPGLPNRSYLDGGANAIALMARYSVLTLLEGMAIIFGVVLLRVLVRRVWLAALLAIALFSINSIAMLLGGRGSSLDIIASLIGTCIVVFVVVRLGVLVLLVGFLVTFLLTQAPLTADPGRWYFGTSTMLVLFCGAIAICGFVWARAGEPLFGRRLLD